jgi:hypothetical protein
MYADDLTLVTATPQLLQYMLGALEIYAQQKHLTVNVNKSKIMVFRPPRVAFSTAKDEPVINYQTTRLPVVTQFRYLGVQLSDQGGGWKEAAVACRGSMWGAIRRVNRLASDQGVRGSPQVMLQLYRSFVLPHAMYGCQLWGTEFLQTSQDANRRATTSHPLQQTYTSFLRYLLGVRKTVAGHLVLCETVQPPLQFYWLRALLKFWNDLPKASSPLLMSAVDADLDLGRLKGRGWTAQLFAAINNIAREHYPPSTVMHVPINRSGIVQCWMDYWETRWSQVASDPQAFDPQNPTETVPYRESATYAAWFKGAGAGFKWRDLPSYLCSSLPVCSWKAIASLRLGNHGLRVEHGRFQNLEWIVRTCLRCELSLAVDDVAHFLFECDTTRPLRELPEFADIGQNVREFMQSTSFNAFVVRALKLLKAEPSVGGTA